MSLVRIELGKGCTYLVYSLGSRVCGSAEALIKCFVGNVASILRTILQGFENVLALNSEWVGVARHYGIETLISIAIGTDNDRREFRCQRF